MNIDKKTYKILKYFRNPAIFYLVSLSAFRAGSKPGTVKIKFMPEFAYPAGLSGRISDNKSIRFYIFVTTAPAPINE